MVRNGTIWHGMAWHGIFMPMFRSAARDFLPGPGPAEAAFCLSAAVHVCERARSTGGAVGLADDLSVAWREFYSSDLIHSSQKGFYHGRLFLY